MNIHLIYQWRTERVEDRLIIPLERLAKANALHFSHYNLFQYKTGLIPQADIIILSNITRKEIFQYLTEAREHGVRVIYDESIEKSVSGKGVDFIDRLIHEEYRDIRSVNLRDRLFQMVDMITAIDPDIMNEHPCCKSLLKIIKNVTPEVWHDLLVKVAKMPRLRKSSKKKKKILFIAPTFMWPHHYISDRLCRSMMKMGYSVVYYTVRPSRFHREIFCQRKCFDNLLQLQIGRFSEEAWKIPLLIDKEEPDLVMTLQGYVIPREILKEIQRRKILSAVWFINEPYDTPRSISYGCYFTHVFLQDRSALAVHRHVGNPNTFYMPLGSDPENDSDELKRNGSIIITGVLSSEGKALYDRLKAQGYEVDACWYGNGDKSGHVKDSLGGLETKGEIFEKIKRSRMVISCQGREVYKYGNSILEKTSPDYVTFLGAASKTFQIVHSETRSINEFFEPGRDVVVFNDYDSCFELVEHYLSDGEAAKEIARSSYERLCQSHTLTSRIESMLRIIDENEAIYVRKSHFTVNYINVGCKDEMSPERVPETGIVTVMSPHHQDRIDLNKRINYIYMPEGSPLSDILNRAITDSPSDYIIVSSSPLWDNHRRLKEIISEFTKNLYLGMVILRDTKSGEYGGFIIPQRVILEAGKFCYSSASVAIEDMRYRLEDKGWDVMEVNLENLRSLNESSCSNGSDVSEKEMFISEWTDNPEKRILANSILRLLIENHSKLTEDEAMATVAKALELSPSFVEGHEYIAKLYLGKGLHRKARKHLECIWKLKPDNITSGILYAISLALDREYEKAEIVLDEILLHKPEPEKRASIYYQKGILSRQRGDLDRAEERFRTALETDPYHMNAMKELSMILIERKRLRKALKYKKMLLSFLQSDETMNDIGVIYYMMENYKEAYNWFANALKKNPVNRSALMNIITLTAETKRDKNIKEYIYTYFNHFPEDSEMLKRINELYKVGSV